MSKNGATVAAFEREFASYVGARFAIALCNGTATLHTALLALGVKPGDRVAVPPLTMSATTIAVLQAGAVPVFCDVDSRTWLMRPTRHKRSVPVALYGLRTHIPMHHQYSEGCVLDAAQTLWRVRPYQDTLWGSFVSYSFQASKILALGEGGALVTNSEELAIRARSISSLGYEMRADQPRIDPKVLKSPTFERHHRFPAWNYRMNDLTALAGLAQLDSQNDRHSSEAVGHVDWCLKVRRNSAALYRDAIEGCDWLTPQHVPDGWTHDYWCYAVACDTHERAIWLADEMERQGGERPYPAWRLTYTEPAFRHLAPDGTCPVAESLQPRLLQFQTNDLASAERNAKALTKAIRVAAPA